MISICNMDKEIMASIIKNLNCLHTKKKLYTVYKTSDYGCESTNIKYFEDPLIESIKNALKCLIAKQMGRTVQIVNIG